MPGQNSGLSFLHKNKERVDISVCLQMVFEVQPKNVLNSVF
jgi:hypothetical protein